jgi:hypothetical protein
MSCYRGDIHRHTEISRDGKNDSSLWDTYRYAFHAASLDFLGVSGHNESGGPDIEYINYMLQAGSGHLLRLGPVRAALWIRTQLELSERAPQRHVAKRGIPTLRIPPKSGLAHIRNRDGYRLA